MPSVKRDSVALSNTIFVMVELTLQLSRFYDLSIDLDIDMDID